MPSSTVSVQRIVQSPQQKVPTGVAVDPSCQCLAMTNVFGGTAVAWYHFDGTPVSRPTVASSSAYNPYGVALLPDGTMYFIDIHVTCTASGCGTTSNGGGLYRVTFDAAKHPTLTRIAGNMSFPTSVTVCDGSTQVCPLPTKDYGAPFKEPAKTAGGG
jgi:DNA-binding beta-propeller fold protein YncE